MRKHTMAVIVIALLGMAGCYKVGPRSVEAAAASAPATTTLGTAIAPESTVVPQPAAAPAPADSAQSPAMTLPAGTSFRVRLQEALDTRRNRPGDRFTAMLDEPLVEGNRVVVPKGTNFTGHIIEARPSGRFKGRAVMALRLDSFVMNGRTYQVRSTDSSRVSAGHKKHHFAWIGGGAGGGALIGAVAGGGAGALIGAGAGAAAGTIGSVITGKRQIHLPVEMTLRFTLRDGVNIRS